MTHGANETFLSAPAASARIKSWERETGELMLFFGNKRISLTSAGEVFLRQARLVIRQMEFLPDEMIKTEVGHIRLFATQPPSPSSYRKSLPDFFPSTQV